MNGKLKSRRAGSIPSAAAVLSLVLSGALLAGSPRIQVDRKDFDFGRRYQGESIEHVFVIRNAGDDTLRINNVRSSCGCTATLLDKHALAPGESAELKATFSTGRFRGQVEKMISVYSNDEQNPTTILQLQGEVAVDLEVSPTQLYFVNLKQGERLERQLTISNLSDQPIEIKEVASTVPELKMELAKLRLKPGESTTLRLSVDKVTEQLRLTGDLTIYNTSKQDKIKVPMFGGRIN